MYKMSYLLKAGKVEKLILDPDPDQSQNLNECTLSEGIYPSQNFMNIHPQISE